MNREQRTNGGHDRFRRHRYLGPRAKAYLNSMSSHQVKFHQLIDGYLAKENFDGSIRREGALMDPPEVEYGVAPEDQC